MHLQQTYWTRDLYDYCIFGKARTIVQYIVQYMQCKNVLIVQLHMQCKCIEIDVLLTVVSLSTRSSVVLSWPSEKAHNKSHTDIPYTSSASAMLVVKRNEKQYCFTCYLDTTPHVRCHGLIQSEPPWRNSTAASINQILRSGDIRKKERKKDDQPNQLQYFHKYVVTADLPFLTFSAATCIRYMV